MILILQHTGRLLAVIILLILLFPPHGISGTSLAEGDRSGMRARISFLTGHAVQTQEGNAASRPLSVGDLLIQGDQILIERGSRMEITLPDTSAIRCDELTRIKIEAVALDKQTGKRYVHIQVESGNMWATVSPVYTGRGDFIISTKTADIDVRGTVFRIHVNMDKSAAINVYQGEINVRSRPSTAQEQLPGSPQKWDYIVRPLQKIVIHPDGSATRPFRFSVTADENGWVRWNRQRDAAIHP